jgi:hypothetical protein
MLCSPIDRKRALGADPHRRMRSLYDRWDEFLPGDGEPLPMPFEITGCKRMHRCIVHLPEHRQRLFRIDPIAFELMAGNPTADTPLESPIRQKVEFCNLFDQPHWIVHR